MEAERGTVCKHRLDDEALRLVVVRGGPGYEAHALWRGVVRGGRLDGGGRDRAKLGVNLPDGLVWDPEGHVVDGASLIKQFSVRLYNSS